MMIWKCKNYSSLSTDELYQILTCLGRKKEGSKKWGSNSAQPFSGNCCAIVNVESYKI